MKEQILTIFLAIIAMISLSCKKEEISNRDKLMLGKWDCVDYADSVSNEFKGRPPVFISHLYEKGYVFRKNNVMWTRNKGGDDKMYTDKRVGCEWVLSEDHLRVSLIFPDDVTETYDIVELSRKELVLRGNEGPWADVQSTYLFSKQ